MCISLLNKNLALVLISIVLSSCALSSTDEDVFFSIESPVASWTYYSDTEVLLAVNVKTDGVVWFSSLDGELGTGNGILRMLSSGRHIISADVNGAVRTVDIVVHEKTYKSYDEIRVFLNTPSIEKKVPAFDLFPYVLSCGGPVRNLSISFPLPQPSIKPEAGSESLMRDIPLRLRSRPSLRWTRSMTAEDIQRYSLGDRRVFQVIDTSNQFGPTHSIEAVLTYVSANISVWVPFGISIDPDLFSSFCEEVETAVVPRVSAIWGACADIDGSGNIAILFSHTINDEGLALGFFNQGDFFDRDNDPSSASYNPSSNEMDLIYLAVPDVAPNTSYSLKAILATCAHEMTHAVNFTRKTWNRIQLGDTDPPLEEVFLDEGWSHLSENLCGYAVSGGNIQFLKAYLNNTAFYSLCGANASGGSDSAGRRGAMALFLSWLFWEKGGMSWNADDSLLVSDLGGINFLKTMVESAETGWNSIGSAYGESTRSLFLRFVSAVNKERLASTVYAYRVDPWSGEPVEFFPNMGTFAYGSGSVEIGQASVSTPWNGNSISLVPWSFIGVENILSSTPRTVHISVSENAADAFVSFLLR